MISSELSGSHHHPKTAILKMSIEIAASFNQSPSHRVLPSAKFYLTSALERTAIAIESKEFTKSAILQPSDRPSVSPMLQNTPPMAIFVPLQSSMSILMAPRPIGGVACHISFRVGSHFVSGSLAFHFGLDRILFRVRSHFISALVAFRFELARISFQV
jgi:hypothetical protein